MDVQNLESDSTRKIRDRLKAEDERSLAYRKQWRKREIASRKSRERVYFIECERFVKIGFTSCLLQRLGTLTTNNPFPCKVLGQVIGGRRRELEIHNRFADHHHAAEWFHLTPELRTEILALIENESPANAFAQAEATA